MREEWVSEIVTGCVKKLCDEDKFE